MVRGFIAGANRVLSEISEIIVGKKGDMNLMLKALEKRMKAFRTGDGCVN